MPTEHAEVTALLRGLTAFDIFAQLLCLILSSKCISLYGNKVINDYGLEESGIDTDYPIGHIRGLQR
jgi:hypothetical protein